MVFPSILFFWLKKQIQYITGFSQEFNFTDILIAKYISIPKRALRIDSMLFIYFTNFDIRYLFLLNFKNGEFTWK